MHWYARRWARTRCRERCSEARGRIEALIRMLAPLNSPQRFTPAELDELNARRQSRARFDPYGTAAPR